jgi:hypothetical protein
MPAALPMVTRALTTAHDAERAVDDPAERVARTEESS